MIRSLEVVLVSLLVCAFLCYAKSVIPCTPGEFKCSNENCNQYTLVCFHGDDCGDNSDEKFCARGSCHPLSFQCLSGECISRGYFCKYGNECRDNSDERYCNKSIQTTCPTGWSECPNKKRCIPSGWVCDDKKDCTGESEELNCGNNSNVKLDLKSWFLIHKKTGSSTHRWGSQVHRVAVALHLADNSTFSPGNSTGEEIRNELTIQLLHRLSKDNKISTQELALYIHALLVACIDPKDFYGEDLVRELRRRVEMTGQFANPFLVLVLCNAGDAMTMKDVERVNNAYDSAHRPFWTDFQAISAMALSCISSRNSVAVDERTIMDMLQELKRHQFRNGTVDNFRATALVTQALFIHDSYKKDFDLDAAIKVLSDGLNQSMSLQNAYYALPVFSRKNLLYVSSSHCAKEPVSEEDALQKTLDAKGETLAVHYSVWMGEEINVGQTWRLKMRVNSTVYDAIENVAKIDNRQKVEYNVVDGKPFVSALLGKEDDPEMGMFWFIYLKMLNSDETPKIAEESPVDIKLSPNQEIILWYKRGPWNHQNSNQNSVTPA